MKCAGYGGERDVPCKGEVSERSLYMGQLCVPLCNIHYTEFIKAGESYKKIWSEIEERDRDGSL